MWGDGAFLFCFGFYQIDVPVSEAKEVAFLISS